MIGGGQSNYYTLTSPSDKPPTREKPLSNPLLVYHTFFPPQNTLASRLPLATYSINLVSYYYNIATRQKKKPIWISNIPVPFPRLYGESRTPANPSIGHFHSYYRNLLRWSSSVQMIHFRTLSPWWKLEEKKSGCLCAIHPPPIPWRSL